MRVARVRLKNIHKVKKKLASGAVAEYHYLRGGARFWGPESPFKVGSEDYVKAYIAAQKTPDKDIPRFRSIIIRYKKSEDFTSLAPRTKKDYNLWMARIDAEFGNAPLEAFDSPKIRAKAFSFRDRWTGRQAQYAWQMLARLSSWAYKRRILSFHHLRDGGTVYKSDRSDIIWKPTDIKAVLDIAPTYIRHAFITAIETGLRPGDLVKLSESHIEDTEKGRRIVIRTNKKKRIAAIPI